MRRRLLTLAGYSFAAALSVSLFVVLDGTWRADLRLPLRPLTDDFTWVAAAVLKGMVDNPWYSHNAFLGAPVGLDLHDFPIPDLVFLASVKGATLFTKNPFVIANAALVLSFPIATLPALFVLRRLGIRYSIALAASLLYAFLPFHHYRGLTHINYAIGYATVPIAALVALEIARGKPVLFSKGRGALRPKLALGASRSVFAIGAAILIGLTGSAYFPFFSAMTILLAGAFGAYRAKDALPILRAGVLAVAIAAAFVTNLAPSLLYYAEHGRTSVLLRNPAAAEIYGLKLAQLFLPVQGHRVEALRLLTERYDASAPLVNENVSAALGAIGAIGFAYLLVTLAFSWRRADDADGASGDPVVNPVTMQTLRVLAFGAFLVGTVGGVGSLIAYFVSPTLRGYNRISVYIAFAALVALAILVERRARVWTSRFAARAVVLGSCAAIAVGVLDETPASRIDYAAIARDFEDEEAFVSTIESSVPAGSMIYQLPYVPFPEAGPLHGLPDYALFRPYLHSRTLRWSYGSVRERRGDDWNRSMAARPSASMVDALAEAGFAGVYVARAGYADGGEAVERALASIVGPPSVVSRSGDASFYPLAARAAALRGELGDEAFSRARDEVLTPMFLGWLDGFYGPDGDARGTWRWCSARGRFVVANPSKEAKTVMLDAWIRIPGVPPDGHATLRFEGALLDESLEIAGNEHHLQRTLEVPPGEHFVGIHADVPRAPGPDEGRDIYFGVFDAHLAQAP